MEGGKRFAIEQELVAGTIRAAVKDLDVSSLKGRKVAVYIVGMGDHGSGNLIGGRFSVSAILHGQHINTPNAEFQVINTTTTTGSTTTNEENALGYPKETKGLGHDAQIDIGYEGLGAYSSEAVLNPRDSQFLSAVIQEYMVLKGVKVTGEKQAEIDAYVTVDVFGTIRSRKDWYIANQESLIAKTTLELAAIERVSGKVILQPQLTSFEAEYNEQYYFWAGPVSKSKVLRRSDGLLSDFTDMNANNEVKRTSGIDAPFPKTDN